MPAFTERSLKVFLCHASADKVAVRKLYRYLRSKGMDPWLDTEKLLPGQRWQDEIPNALYAADAIIVLLSKNSTTKEGYVQKEIKFALDKALDVPEGRIFLIPARIEECELPDSLKGYQWVDLFREGGNKRLMQSLNLRAESLGLSIGQASTTDEIQSPPDLEKTIPPMDHDPGTESLPERSEENTDIKSVEDTKIKGAPYKRLAPYGIIGIGLIILLGVFPLLKNISGYVLNPSQPTFTSIPLTETLLVPITSQSLTAPALGIGSSMAGNDDMILLYVPAGEFTMGSDSNEDAERPAHTIYLDAFWIDKTEVTNGLYEKCVQAGKCEEPDSNGSNTRESYYDSPEFNNYPVIYVSWNDAKAYCLWANRRLPSEAEWEKAARGTDALRFPWGNNEPSAQLVNYNQGQKMGDTTEVGNYPEGGSPYGALDMAGNVWEWVADWYNESYYAVSPKTNPSGPNSGQQRVLRGGSLFSTDVHSTQRQSQVPDDTYISYGFRCARDATP